MYGSMISRKSARKNSGSRANRRSSHAIFKTPWIGDPRINIQDDKGKAKAYQVRQVLSAIEKLEGIRNER
jgi:hypothetical protein